MRRCLVLLGLIYFQVSTFALVQWLKEHADLHGGLPLPRMRRALDPVDGLPALAWPPTHATTPSLPPLLAAASDSAEPSHASEAPSSPSHSLSRSPPPPLPPPRAGDEDDDAVDERPNELPSLDKEGELGVGEIGEHGGEAGVGEELVGLALPEGAAGVGALGRELGAGHTVVKGRRPGLGRAGRPLTELAAHGSGCPPACTRWPSGLQRRASAAPGPDCCPGASPRRHYKAGSTASDDLLGR